MKLFSCLKLCNQCFILVERRLYPHSLFVG